MKRAAVIINSITVALVLCASAILAPIAHATPLASDWMQEGVLVEKAEQAYKKEKCVYEMRQVALNRLYYYKEEDSHPKNWCVYHYEGFEIVFYQRWFSSVILDLNDPNALFPREEMGMAISYNKGAFIPIDNVGMWLRTSLVYSEGMREVWDNATCLYRGCKITRHDFSEKNMSLRSGTETYLYTGVGIPVAYTDGTDLLGYGINMSKNGKWASFTVANVGLFRMSTDTYEIEAVDTSQAAYGIPEYYGGEGPSTVIDDEGVTIMSLGVGFQPRIVRYVEGCVKLPFFRTPSLGTLAV